MARKRNSKNVDELGRPEETMSCNRYVHHVTSRNKTKVFRTGGKKMRQKNFFQKLFNFFVTLTNSKFLGKNSRLLCLLYDNVSQD